LSFFCRRITSIHPEAFSEQGPLLLVANHPNSFLDAIVIASRFRKPVHFLARGDAFQKPWHGRLLRMLNMIPVYRLSEGKENLPRNEYAFRRSAELLRSEEIVLIFIEGVCVHQHELQPFKKGAARIAWENRTVPRFRVLPMGIAYDSFTRFGKNIVIDLGEPLSASTLFTEADQAKNYRVFNEKMYKEISPRIRVPLQEATNQNALWTTAKLLHLPLYYPLKKIIAQKTAGTVFYDSVLFGVLLFHYPLFLVLVFTGLSFLISTPMAAFITILFPATAWIAIKRL